MDDSFEKYKLNHPVLDLEHYQLLSKIIKIIDLTSSQQYVDKYIKIDIELLVIEWLCHAATEESIMRDAKFPEITNHFAQHNYIKTVFLNLSQAVSDQDSGPITTLTLLLKNIKTVLEQHFVTDDSKFVEWVHSQELLKKD